MSSLFPSLKSYFLSASPKEIYPNEIYIFLFESISYSLVLQSYAHKWKYKSF